MSVIAPGTTIYLLRDVPLDDTFDHTLYWDNTAQGKADQLEWFVGNTNGFVKHSLLNQTYQRVEKGECMVEVVADNAYDCNYMLFQNGAYGNKWFFCFIQDVEYVNNKTTRIRFKIDVMQTWWFDYELIPCFVERQHVATDIFGQHIQDEGIEYGGTYWYDNLYDLELGDNYIVVCGTVRPIAGVTHSFTRNDIEPVGGGGMYNGIYSGVVFNVFRYPVTVNEFLDAVTDANMEPGIVNIFMAPQRFFNDTEVKPIDYDRADDEYGEPGDFSGLEGTFGYSAGTVKVEPTEFLVRGIDIPTTIGNYTPRNKKLLCYPYSVLTVTNNNGKVAEYRYEFFSDRTVAVFKCILALSSTPEACVYPKNYKHVEDNYLEKLVIDDYPQCAYSIDSYKAWLAQNRYKLAFGLGSDIGQIAGSVYGGNPEGVFSGFSNVFQKMAQVKTAQTLPPHAKGEQTNTMMMAIHKQGFHFYQARITDYYAELIDKYFDRFGYVSNRIVVPNRNVRNHFTFCKTRNCDINAKGMPDKYVKEVKAIYDNGITFWSDHNKNNIGKYTDIIFEDNQAPHS